MISDMRVSLSVLTGLFLLSILVGCGSSQNVKTGKVAFDLEQYRSAAEMLMKEADQENDQVIKSRKFFLIGECYRLAASPAEAETWYEEAEKMGYGGDASFHLALMYKYQEKYQQAIEKFKTFISENPNDAARGEHELRGCELALKWQGSKTMYDIFKMDAINSPYIDFAPVFYENKALVITSSRDDRD
jgi:tetratricopeptide (TPR) repeat protein